MGTFTPTKLQPIARTTATLDLPADPAYQRTAGSCQDNRNPAYQLTRNLDLQANARP